MQVELVRLAQKVLTDLILYFPQSLLLVVGLADRAHQRMAKMVVPEVEPRLVQVAFRERLALGLQIKVMPVVPVAVLLLLSELVAAVVLVQSAVLVLQRRLVMAVLAFQQVLQVHQ